MSSKRASQAIKAGSPKAPSAVPSGSAAPVATAAKSGGLPSPPGVPQSPQPQSPPPATGDGDIAGEGATATRAQLSWMKTVLGREASRGDEHAKALLETYEGLPRFDRTKQELFGLWQKDKTCQWLNGWQHSRSMILTRDKSQVNGWQTEREVATLLSYDVQDPAFQRILARPAQH